MAADRMKVPVGTSDPLAALVLGALVIGLVALFGLMVLLDNEDPPPEGQAASATSEVPSVPAGVPAGEPSPTAAGPDGRADDDGDAVAGGGPAGAPTPDTGDEPTAQERPSEPAARTTPDAVPPLEPRGMRSETPVVPPPAAGSEPPSQQEPEQSTEPPREEPEQGTEPAPGAPAVPPSGIDDPDREPTLVINDDPVDRRSVLADLDGDRVPERVSAALVRNTVEVTVERYVGGEQWEEVTTAMGAVADDLVGLWVRDVTGDDRPEVYTKQWVGVYGESVTLWSYADGRLQSMTASGGCWDGGNTFGVVGALVRRGQVVAICEEDELPTALWPTDVYVWADGRWTFDRRIGEYS